MSAKAEYKLLVLFDEEIRLAAKLLSEFRKAAYEANDERAQKLAAEALLACGIALEGADADDKCIIVHSYRKMLP